MKASKLAELASEQVVSVQVWIGGGGRGPLWTVRCAPYVDLSLHDVTLGYQVRVWDEYDVQADAGDGCRWPWRVTRLVARMSEKAQAWLDGNLDRFPTEADFVEEE